MPTSTTQQTEELDSSDKYHPKTVQPSTFWPVFNYKTFSMRSMRLYVYEHCTLL